jgi:hypothetical protein
MPDLFRGTGSIVETSDAFLFGCEAVLPVQFYGARSGEPSAEPLRRLMVAVLVDAVRCFQTKSEARNRAALGEFAEVRSWFFSREQSGVFAFKSICDLLEIDPDRLRKWLLRWQERRASGEKPAMIRRSPAVYRKAGVAVTAREDP